MPSSVREDSSIVIATHIIGEIESVLDEVFFLDSGQIALKGNVDDLRQTRQMSVEELYKEVYAHAEHH